MDIRVKPGLVSGTVAAPSSKSFAHRLLICAALADRETALRVNGLSDDILATERCLEALGCVITADSSSTTGTHTAGTERTVGTQDKGDGLILSHFKCDKIRPSPLSCVPTVRSAPAVCVPVLRSAAGHVVLDCGESGSTARFLLPVAAHFCDSFTMTGRGKLPGRPFAPLCRALTEAGCVFDGTTLPLSGKGGIKAGEYRIEGDISSQFISGLLFALPLLDGDSRIVLTSELQSAAYVDMTIEALEMFGVSVETESSGFRVRGRQKYISPGELAVEGDWSNAAFFLCMGALRGPVSLSGLNLSSSQGDREVIEILKRMGADIEMVSAHGGRLRGIEIDASQIPDLVPVLAVVAAASDGETRIFNAQRLRLKESDRIESTCKMLKSIGADVQITEDGLIVRGREKLEGGVVDSAGDHRIVMAAATAACVCEGPVVIKGAEAVNKSYPSFFEDLKSIGGVFDVV